MRFNHLLLFIVPHVEGQCDHYDTAPVLYFSKEASKMKAARCLLVQPSGSPFGDLPGGLGKGTERITSCWDRRTMTKCRYLEKRKVRDSCPSPSQWFSVNPKTESRNAGTGASAMLPSDGCIQSLSKRELYNAQYQTNERQAASHR